MKYFISAGEVSGDLHGSRLIEALRRHDSEASFDIIGGDEMARHAATKPIVHISELSVMGFSAVFKSLPALLRHLAVAKEALRRGRPDTLIVIDFPSFNLRLAEAAHRLGIPVYFYIPPKVWAWRSRRVRKMRNIASDIFSIFPFEPDFYASHGISSAYVGNPTVKEIDECRKTMMDNGEFRAYHNLTSRPIIALVPGSRLSEIRANLPIMDAVARRHRGYQCVVAGAPGVDFAFYRQFTKVPVVFGVTAEVMAHSRAALVTSGTATLECALHGTPQVACYRSNGSRLVYNIMRRLLHVGHVTLPNLILDESLIPEMLLHQCEETAVDRQLSAILDDTPERSRQIEGYARLRAKLGNADAADSTARAIVEALTSRKGLAD